MEKKYTGNHSPRGETLVNISDYTSIFCCRAQRSIHLRASSILEKYTFSKTTNHRSVLNTPSNLHHERSCPSSSSNDHFPFCLQTDTRLKFGNLPVYLHKANNGSTKFISSMIIMLQRNSTHPVWVSF